MWGIKYLRMYGIKFSKDFAHVWDKNFEKNKDTQNLERQVGDKIFAHV